MSRWMRFRALDGTEVFGRSDGGYLHQYQSLDEPRATGEVLSTRALVPLAPCAPGKVVALWNNHRERAAAGGGPTPDHPLFLLKPAGAVIGSGAAIRRPAGYTGRIVAGGELGIVIGKPCRRVGEEEAAGAIFGYTIVNDIAAADLLNEHPNFPQWCRAKGFDTFCCIGPAIASDFDWAGARVVTRVDGVEQQNDALADMAFTPARQISLISHDMALAPGDVIVCGTSPGTVVLPDGASVTVSIDGIGMLSNVLSGAAPATGEEQEAVTAEDAA